MRSRTPLAFKILAITKKFLPTIGAILLLAGCDEPVEPIRTWDQMMDQRATEENLTLLGMSEIGRQKELVEVLNSLSLVREAQSVIERLVNVEETGFSAFCNSLDDNSEFASFPVQLSFREVVKASSELEIAMNTLRADKARACWNYKNLLSNRLISVEGSVPRPNGSNESRNWVPAVFDITNNSTRALGPFGLSWVITIRNRQTSVAQGSFRVDVVGGIEPGEAVTKSFGLGSLQTPGFDRRTLEEIREAMAVFGQEQLQIEACVSEYGRGNSISCLSLEGEFQDSFKKMNRTGLEVSLILSEYFINRPEVTPKQSA